MGYSRGMKITKIGHCAMVVEHEGVRLLTDPGSYTADRHTDAMGLHAVLITHEHGDHLHVESLKQVLTNNPEAVVVGNSAVAAIVAQHIPTAMVVVVGDAQSADINGVRIDGINGKHEEIYQDFGMVENTGYFVGGKFFFPGDSFHNPGRAVDVLALPVAGPWMKISQAIAYAKAVKPRVAFGVHDGMITPDGGAQKWCEALLPKEGIEFVTLKAGETAEF